MCEPILVEKYYWCESCLNKQEVSGDCQCCSYHPCDVEEVSIYKCSKCDKLFRSDTVDLIYGSHLQQAEKCCTIKGVEEKLIIERSSLSYFQQWVKTKEEVVKKYEEELRKLYLEDLQKRFQNIGFEVEIKREDTSIDNYDFEIIDQYNFRIIVSRDPGIPIKEVQEKLDNIIKPIYWEVCNISNTLIVTEINY